MKGFKNYFTIPYYTKVKRHFVTTILLLSCLSNAACFRFNIAQSTSETEIPVRVDATIERENIFPKIVFASDVQGPTRLEFPIITVKKRKFSVEAIREYIRLLGGNPKELYIDYELSQEEWEAIIRRAEQLKDPLQILSPRIDYLREQYRNASAIPMNKHIELEDTAVGELSKLFFRGTGDGMSVLSIIRDSNKLTYFREMNCTILGKSLCEDYATDPEAGANGEWLMPGDPETTYTEAYVQAANWMEMLGIDLDLYSAETCSIITNRVIKTSGWKFVYTRKIDELQAQFVDGAWCYINPRIPPRIGAPWDQEFCIIVIDGRGLCELWWQGASVIAQGAKPRSLLNFRNIQNSISNQLRQMYADDDAFRHEIKIIAIELGTSMIAVKDQNNIGEYVPTWYVVYEDHLLDGNASITELEQIMFNAVDGSYIEPRVLQEKVTVLNN